jgi:quinol monooxygenase YgiN
MVKVVAKSNFKHDKIDEAIKLYQELVEKTREEDGCIVYELYQDNKDSSVLTMIEEWTDEEALAKHMKTEHFLRIVPLVGEFTEGSELNIYHKVI